MCLKNAEEFGEVNTQSIDNEEHSNVEIDTRNNEECEMDDNENDNIDVQDMSFDSIESTRSELISEMSTMSFADIGIRYIGIRYIRIRTCEHRIF